MQVDAASVPEALRHGSHRTLTNNTVEYPIDGGTTPGAILSAYSEAGIAVDRFERMIPSLNDIFIEEVSRARNNA